jgi:hypothetical protein
MAGARRRKRECLGTHRRRATRLLTPLATTSPGLRRHHNGDEHASILHRISMLCQRLYYERKRDPSYLLCAEQEVGTSGRGTWGRRHVGGGAWEHVATRGRRHARRAAATPSRFRARRRHPSATAQRAGRASRPAAQTAASMPCCALLALDWAGQNGASSRSAAEGRQRQPASRGNAATLWDACKERAHTASGAATPSPSLPACTSRFRQRDLQLTARCRRGRQRRSPPLDALRAACCLFS